MIFVEGRIPTPVCALARNDRGGRQGDVGIAPYGMTENGADRVVRPYKRTVKGHR